MLDNHQVAKTFAKPILAVMLALSISSPIFALENNLTICAPQPIQVANTSSHWVSVLGIRWLNEGAGKWIIQPVNSEFIRQGETWRTTLTPWGLEDKRTFYQVKYKFLKNEDQMKWSETKTTSQAHVADCGLGEPVEILIVDLR